MCARLPANVVDGSFWRRHCTMCSLHTLQRHGIIGVPTDYRTHQNGTRMEKTQSKWARERFTRFFRFSFLLLLFFHVLSFIFCISCRSNTLCAAHCSYSNQVISRFGVYWIEPSLYTSPINYYYSFVYFYSLVFFPITRYVHGAVNTFQYEREQDSCCCCCWCWFLCVFLFLFSIFWYFVCVIFGRM